MLDDPWTDLDSVAGLNYKRVLTCFVLVWDTLPCGRSPLSLGKLSPAAAATTWVGGWLKETWVAAGASLSGRIQTKLPGVVCLGDGAGSLEHHTSAWLG